MLSPFDADRLRETLDAAHAHIAAIRAFLDRIGEVLGHTVGERLEDIPRLVVGLRHLAQMPTDGRAALGHPAWRSNRERIRSLHDHGCHWSDRCTQLGQQVSDVVWEMQLEPLRETIAVYGNSFFCVFRGSYRRAVVEFGSVCRDLPPKAHADRVRLLDHLITAQKARRWLAEEASFAEAVLGELWAGEASPWSKVAALIAWVEQSDKALAGIDALRAEVLSAALAWDDFAEEFERSLADLRAAVARIVTLTGIEWTLLLGLPNWEAASVAGFADAIDGWQASLDLYNEWVVAAMLWTWFALPVWT